VRSRRLVLLLRGSLRLLALCHLLIYLPQQ